MNRTLLTIATAAFAITGFFASDAQACISCEYVPEVAKSSKAQKAKVYSRTLISAVKMPSVRLPKASLAKANLAKSQAFAKKLEAQKVQTAEAKPETEKTETKPETENTDDANSKPVDVEAAKTEETEVASNVGCRKFFPAIGTTLAVDCE